MKLRYSLTSLLLFIFVASSYGQNGPATAEDSLQKGWKSFLAGTTIGGYGNAFYQRDFNLKTSTVNLERFVLFVGHSFGNRVSFFSELEVEDAKVSGGEEGGELALEQCYLKFNLNPGNYIVAGLFLPRIGILNEDHLPTTFNGNERTEVETVIIPSTWRELGIGLYGNIGRTPLAYSLGLMNGLNSAGFEHGSGIRGGRFEGREASANNLALTGSLQYYQNSFKAQVSGYYGGTVGLAPEQADSLSLSSGFFGTPVILGAVNIQYEVKGFTIRALGSVVSIPDAFDINRAYANNTAELEYGVYAELAYNLFFTMEKLQSQSLVAFIRYEKLDINASIPSNGITDGTLNQQHVVFGLGYLPVKNAIVKADVRLMNTGEQNPELIINPSPTAPPYQETNTFLNLGIGFSF